MSLGHGGRRARSTGSCVSWEFGDGQLWEKNQPVREGGGRGELDELGGVDPAAGTRVTANQEQQRAERGAVAPHRRGSRDRRCVQDRVDSYSWSFFWKRSVFQCPTDRTQIAVVTGGTGGGGGCGGGDVVSSGGASEERDVLTGMVQAQEGRMFQ